MQKGSTGDAANRFYCNASLGLNGWWRWYAGVAVIALAWLEIGRIPWRVACQYVRRSHTLNFSCDGVTISGASLVPGFLLSFCPFVIGMVGLWLAVKLLHRKSLTQVATGRETFDYNRVLFAILIGFCLYLAWFLVKLAFFHSEAHFRDPDVWEYLTFFLFAIVLIPCQAGFEEGFFRGYILQRLMLFGRSKWFLVPVSALMFAALHMANPEPRAYGPALYFISIFLFGAFATLITLFDGGIELTVGYHAVKNLFITLVANTEVSAVPSPSLFVLPIDRYDLFPSLLVDIVVYVLAAAIFNLRYRWFRRTIP